MTKEMCYCLVLLTLISLYTCELLCSTILFLVQHVIGQKTHCI